VQDELERLQGKAEQQGIQLVLEAATDGLVPGTELEAEQFGQGLFNVIDNALGAAHYRVTVYLSRRLEGYAISVVDDGPGIDRELLPRVTEPFVSTKGEGSGMGLYIATAAARRWGGELRLQNIPEGGLRATFWLPSKR
jgi:signal transduction histidine kinase